MQNEKSAVSSVTNWAGLFVIIHVFARQAGYDFDPAVFSQLAVDLVDAVAGAVAIYGRIRAQAKITHVA